MRKLRLDVEELSVESFPTDDAGEELGTVYGHSTTKPSLLPPSCPVACETYDDTICGLSRGC